MLYEKYIPDCLIISKEGDHTIALLKIWRDSFWMGLFWRNQWMKK